MKGENRTKQQNKKVGKKPAQKKKYPLRGKPVIYRDPFKSIAVNDWESLNNAPARVPENDKGKIIIMPDFDDPLPEFDDE